ncbi:transcription factor LAF1 [Corchorus olitorius]|uniref:Transcription factor LAF1 n=1 Tax=Corchorus olitorius TaxID=93759 RepID=A0A1R3JSN9_9ROSI|nr:transcription factor LAF1 [Corchorus olitorius]
MPSYEPLMQFDKSSINVDQAVPQHFDFAKDPNKGSLPKLLFAEWLSLDQEGGNFANSGKAVASSDGFNQGSVSNFQDPFMNSFILNDGAFGSDHIHEGLSNASVNDMFNSQFKFETQISGNEFVGSLSGDDICSDFNINTDVMYI